MTETTLEESCDPVCFLLDCAREQFGAVGWDQDSSCKGKIDVIPYVTRMQRNPNKQKMRGCCTVQVVLTLMVDVEVDSCSENSCTAGLVQNQVCKLIESKSFCNGCARANWIDTAISRDHKNNTEYRQMTFTVFMTQKKNNNKETTDGIQRLR